MNEQAYLWPVELKERCACTGTPPCWICDPEEWA